ncbi:aspartyl/glutamyl-tRNA amidotransferase subunit A [Candidatus Pacearchaeota archaeon]|nr:aspartyl/glutamyl-tRNA amidotransferase subunit A [Candidatus Pacearchaeota archaeon]
MVSENLKNYLKEIEKNNKKGKKINAILEVNPNVLKEAKKSGHRSVYPKISGAKLAGKVIAVKANINVKGLHASCGSKVLEDYKAGYDAEVIKRIKDEGGIILGMANCDEFACGSSGETSAFGPTKNPAAPGFVPGGSSSGSAAAVSADFCDLSLGSDTGCSIRLPASFCNVVGIKPTYSSVSRYGLIDLSMSLDQIGVIAKNVSDAALLLSVIRGKDEKDSISQESEKINLSEIEKTPTGITVGVLDFESKDKKIDDLIEEKIEEAVKKYGWKVRKVKINYLDLAIATYYPLVYVEFFSATRRLDGRRYGKKIEDAAGPEVMRRILGGSEISKAEHHDRYYHLALKAKKLIEEELEKAFGKVDCIISPVCPKLPHKIGESISVEDMYAYDALTIPYNLYGNCALSLPVGKIDGIPVGMQVACDKFEDEKMLRIARSIEKLRG